MFVARGNMTFGDYLSVSLNASPHRLLLVEGKSVEEAAHELHAELLEFPKRTKAQIRRYGPGQPKVRSDVLAIELGKKRLALREELDLWGRDVRDIGRQVQVLERLAELAGGLDEDLVAAHEWPPPPRRPPGG